MTDNQPWTEKYRPETTADVQGNNAAVDDLKTWAANFPADRTPQLLVGPPGVGKTSTVEAIANELDLQLVEMNTSADRSGDAVEAMAATIRNTNVDDEPKLVLLDEVDSWHHATDLRPLYDALESPPNLVVLTANDKWETPDGFERRANVRKFRLGKRSIKAKLKQIVAAEGLDLDGDTLDALADRPDLRSAITDLQLAARDGEAGDDQGEYDITEWDMLDQVLTGTPDLGTIKPGEAILWLDENVANVYRGLEQAWAYEALARADVALMRDQALAESLVETVARLRRTEPYYADEVSRKKKSFPEWFRHRVPKPTGEAPEARLYRALKDYDGGTFQFAGSYHYFRRVILPHLRELNPDAKHELILHHRLSPDEYEALGVQRSDHESWIEAESPTAGEWGGTTESADAW